MSRLSEVLEQELLRQDNQQAGARWKAKDLANAVFNAFDSDATLAEMVRPLPSPDSLPLCAVEDPEPQDIDAALEASLAAIRTMERTAERTWP